jgi:hypothetical protein
MKLCLMILSVPWYMFNGLEHTYVLYLFIRVTSLTISKLASGLARDMLLQIEKSQAFTTLVC